MNSLDQINENEHVFMWVSGGGRTRTCEGDTLKLRIELTRLFFEESARRARDLRGGCLTAFSKDLVNLLFPDHKGSITSNMDVEELLRTCLPRGSMDAGDVEVQPKTLVPMLLPFQRRAVFWMLEREQFKGRKPVHFTIRTPTAPYEVVLETDLGNLFLFNTFTGELTAFRSSSGIDPKASSTMQSCNSNWLFESIENLKGGILADEMGLGKTVETLALILLNPMPMGIPTADHGSDLLIGKATVIITPSVILTQWISEIERHGPSLSVLDAFGTQAPRLGQRAVWILMT